LVDKCTVGANFFTKMDAVKIKVEVDNSLSSVASTGAIHLSHIGHESEEDVPAPFIFVDVNVSQEEPYFVRIKPPNSLMFCNMVTQTHP
jgi:hypothetical protein